MVEATGSFDDVAAAVIAGAWPFVIAVCAEPAASADLAAWLDSAIPAMGPQRARRCKAAQLEEAIEREAHTGNVVLVVEDAAEGDDAALRERWTFWNTRRDRLRVALRTPETGNAVVFLMTRRRMPEITLCAADLISVSHVLTATEEPFALDPADMDGREAFEHARATLEQRYGIPTEEVVRRLFEREPMEIAERDLNRWKAVAEALRNVDAA